MEERRRSGLSPPKGAGRGNGNGNAGGFRNNNFSGGRNGPGLIVLAAQLLVFETRSASSIELLQLHHLPGLVLCQPDFPESAAIQAQHGEEG